MPSPDTPGPARELPAGEQARRVALRRKVVLRSEEADGFVIGHAINVSRTGMFIGCSQPWPPATVFSFEFRLADGDPPVRGKALVTWVRPKQSAAERPAGMGVEFLELEPAGRRLVDHFVDVESPEHDEGSWAELKGLRSTVSSALGSALPEAPPSGATAALASGPPVARRAPRRRWPWLAAAGGVALLASLFLAGPWQAGQGEPPEPGREGSAALQPTEPGAGEAPASADESAVAAAVGERAPQAPAPPAEPSVSAVQSAAPAAGPPAPSLELFQPGPESVRAMVQDWARAWSAQRADLYLAYYSPSFVAPDGLSRAEWEAQRRRRLQEPGFLRVAITALEAEATGPRSYRARFFQSYRSDRFSDVVRKTLDLAWEGGGWKIVGERSESE